MKSLQDLQVGRTLNVENNKFNDADAIINLSFLELRERPVKNTLYLVDVSGGIVLTPTLDEFKGYNSIKASFAKIEHKNYISYRTKSGAIKRIAKTLGAVKGTSLSLYSSEIEDGNGGKIEGALYLGTESETETETEV